MTCYCDIAFLSPDTNLQCKRCMKVFHPACLKSGRPSNLEGDVLFEFVCVDCSPTKEEQVVRMKLQWSHILMITLYNLQLQGGGRCGFYQWREHICDFVQRNWTTFFGFTKKRTSTWRGTVAGTLSAGCPSTFISGMSKFKEQGWWALKECRPPTRRDLEASSSSSGSSDRKKKKKPVVNELVEPITKGKTRKTSERNKRAKTVELEESSASTFEELGLASIDDSDCLIDSEMQVDEDLIDISPGSMSPFSLDPPSPSIEGILSQVCGSNDSNDFEDVENNDSENVLLPPPPEVPVIEPKPKPSEEEQQFCMTRISRYEEKKLLQGLENFPHALATNAQARRLRRKLLLLKTKRELNLPVFDLDHFVVSRKFLTEPQLTKEMSDTNPLSNFVLERGGRCILDRYQVSSSTKFNTHSSLNKSTFMTKLLGSDECHIVISPYTSRRLKPFIWQDFEAKPIKLRLLEEIQQRGQKLDQEYEKPPSAPITYCYVRPHHIPTVNALCREFFWPGIDMSESLQYPDFSCIAQYKKVVIGFAFMVPDVKFNEAYISFIFTHPEWRRAGIATFMLYHLIQTCIRQDVTLHVSVTNPALFLYQKFGFKIEEFIVDFYDKYFSEDSNECKHALFIRRSR